MQSGQQTFRGAWGKYQEDLFCLECEEYGKKLKSKNSFKNRVKTEDAGNPFLNSNYYYYYSSIKFPLQWKPMKTFKKLFTITKSVL